VSLPSNGACTITVNVQGASTGNFLNQTTSVTSLEGGNGGGAIAAIAVGVPLKKGL
jgi:hypothetical protein